jgi:hypothetical protein
MAKNLNVLKSVVVLVAVLVMNLKPRLRPIVPTMFTVADSANKTACRLRRQAVVSGKWVSA